MRLPKIKLPENTFSAVSLAIIGAAIVLLIAGVIYYVQQERQREAINEQTDRTNQLIEEVKALGEENKKLNERSNNYAYCYAMLFARYTQTQQPIVIEDLNKCVFTSEEASRQSSAQPTAQTPSVAPQTSTPAPVVQPSAPAQPANPNTPNNPRAPIVTLPQINVPCINALGLVTTCK